MSLLKGKAVLVKNASGMKDLDRSCMYMYFDALIKTGLKSKKVNGIYRSQNSYCSQWP